MIKESSKLIDNTVEVEFKCHFNSTGYSPGTVLENVLNTKFKTGIQASMSEKVPQEIPKGNRFGT